MSTVAFTPHHSRNALLRMLALFLLLLAAIAFNHEFVRDFYFGDQLSTTGWVVNGLILLLFLSGLGRLTLILLHYRKEERALRKLLDNLELDPEYGLAGVPAASFIAQRYRTLDSLNRRHAPFDHTALAATLVAGESTRTSFPHFINNILILTGVFGTIASLSLALLGASDLLQNADNGEGMNLVIHGMSTALSTTMTAIICYIFFGYAYLKTTDVQTSLVSAIEETTTVHLLPRFQVKQDSILSNVAALVNALREVALEMRKQQREQAGIGQQLTEARDLHDARMQELHAEMAQIRQTLRSGFRLGEQEE
jgi:hypothetical protein